ncbi:HalOD1 output domain-containing protein [Haladaptatus sp. CMAA 1911]|uniref:DUF7504 family protein n=1 Tax=Haladaptatus sp. CMAA 1911 TaxID=3368987 RepID=UPI0037551375
MEKEPGTIPFICGVNKPLEFKYNQQQDLSLGSTIIQHMIKAAGVDPIDVPEPLYASVNTEALEAGIQPQKNSPSPTDSGISFTFAGHYITVQGDGNVRVESELGRLKRTGGNILVTGSVPEDILDQLSVQLLGERSSDRSFIFAQYGKSAQGAQMRHSLNGSPPENAYIVTYEAGAYTRSVAQSYADQPDPVNVSSVVGTLEEFQVAIQEKILELQERRNGYDPGELRFSFDSLRILLEEEETEAAGQFIATVTKRVKDANGLGHYLLPDAYYSDTVKAVKPIFDIVIELQVSVNGLEQRLHLNDTDHTTKWFPI